MLPSHFNVIVLIGPTASGKTALGIEIAEILKTEVISADSRLVYKHLNIGTSKPTYQDMRGIPHHMIDIMEPLQFYSASRYAIEAGKILNNIMNDHNTIPIIVGGTGFYLRVLLEGLEISAAMPDEEYRQELSHFVQTHGQEALYCLLQKIDSDAASKIYVNDTYRLIRALEIYKLTGEKPSKFGHYTKTQYNVLYIGLNAFDRTFIYHNINERVIKMLNLGLIDEVKELVDKYGKTDVLQKTVGYKETLDYLEGIIDYNTLLYKIQKNTRNYAKRQLTWFRANSNITWFNIDSLSKEEIVKKVLERL